MPIYEHYCLRCHTVFSFFTTQAGTERRPDCPKCGRRELPRRPSRFATLRHQGADADDPFSSLDDSRLEGAMEKLLQEAEGLGDEEDPRTMARLMHRFSDLTGLDLGDRMQEFVARLESGEDPESLEQGLETAGADSEDTEDFFRLKKALHDRRKRPRVDEELYFF